MQTIARAEIAAVKYDQTITCTIVDDSLRESGQYIVTDGTTRFTAYSSITSLRNNTVVYVTIPNGDFTQQKVIIGKQMEGEDKSFLYVAPFDNFIRCTPNLLTLDESTNKGNGYRLYANGSLMGDINNIDDICEEIKDKDGNSTGTKLKTTYSIVTERKDLVNYYKDFTRLGIRANFISWLKEYDITSGDYGLSFTISYQDGELEDTTNLAGQNITSGNFDIYKREETGFDINKEYYEKNNNGYKKVDDITKDSYKPNHYYYKNYVLDQDKSPRVRVQKDPSLDNSEDIYYTYYKKDSVIDQDTNAFIKYEFKKIDISKEEYEPGKYYYIPEEGLNEELQYKLSIDNGFIPNCQYFIVINNIFEPILITPETYDVKKNLYGVKPQLKTKYKTFLLDTSQMLGSKYGFDNYYSQEIVFDISGLGTITEILLTFYENGHFISGQEDKTISRDNNTDIEKSLINKGLSKQLFSSNVYNPGYETLVVNDIEVYMGYETQVIGEDSDGYLKLFCYESDKYKATSNPLLNMKNIYLKWAYKNEDGKIYIADKDNVGTFIEQLKDGISDFPIYDDEKKEELVLNYINNLSLDNSPAQVENRNYYERIISSASPNNISGMAGKAYIKANYNFIPNQGNPYNSGRDYFEYGIFPKDVAENIIQAEKLRKQISKISQNGETVEQGIQYLKQVSTGDYLYEYPAIGTTIKGEEWYKYGYQSATDDNYEFIRGYKKINISADISQDKLYNYYYAVYQGEALIKEGESNNNSDNNDYVYIYYLPVDTNIITYKPETFYYYNCPNDLFEVRWYRYTQGAPAADEYSGIYWQEIPNLLKMIKEICNNETLTEEERSSEIKKLYDSYSQITHIIDDFHCELHPDYVYNAKEQIKAVILLTLGETKKVFYSEPIEFFNESPTIDLPSLEVETALAPKFDDGSLGNYYLYGENNSLIDIGDAQTQRSISLLFDVAGGASETRSLLKDADKVTWIFPLENTAIVPSLSLMQGIYTEKDGLGYFEDTEKRQEYKFYYTIEKYYSYTDGDNSIICNVIKDGILYSTTANMSFGQSGSNGSEYTLVLDIMTADGMITLNPTNNLYYKGLVNYMNIYPIPEGQNIHPYPEKDKEPEGFYYLENVDKEKDKEGNIVLKNKIFKKINIDDYDWLTIKYNNLYVVREFEDTEDNRLVYPCLDEYLYQYEEENKSKVNIHSNPREEEIKIVASLYDQNHKRIDISNYNITWDWKANAGEGLTISDSAIKKDEVILLKNNNIDIDEDMYIISATLSGLTGYDLQSYLCLPLRYDFGPVKYQGPTEILHNSLGVPLFYKDEMNLYYNNKEGQLSKYPHMSFGLFNTNDTNGLGPKLNKLSSDVAEDIFISYDLTDTNQLAENIQYFQNPEIKDISSVKKSTKDKNKAWSGYFTLVEKTDEQNEKVQCYEKIIDNVDIIEEDIAVYDFTNLYSFEIKNNEPDFLCYNNCKIISKDTFEIVSKQDTLIETTENTLTEKLLKKYASKYYLYEAKNDYFSSITWNDKDQAYLQQNNEIYKVISKSEYDEIAKDSKPQLYIPIDYDPIVYGQNQDIDIPLFNINYQYILLEEESNLDENKTYYIPLNYKEDETGEYYKWYEKKSISSIIFKENTYYSWDENNGFKLILNLAEFQNLAECYVFFGYKLINWTEDIDKYKLDISIKYNADFSEYTLIENETEKQDNLNYFIKKEYYELDIDTTNPGQVYYTPSSWEKEVSAEPDWNEKVYFTQSIETKYTPINEEKEEETMYYYKKKIIQKIKSEINNYNFVKELRLIIREEVKLIKNTSTSIKKTDLDNNNYFILDFSVCNPIKDDYVLTNDYCFVKTENKILNEKSSSSIAKGEGCFLQVPSIYIDGLEQFAIQLKYNNITIFSIPVLYYLNRYFSSTINKWDGELSVDSPKNTILAKMMGAGRKQDNLFSGVIMGDWSQNTNSDLGIGIYGFNNGETSFGFTDDGQGFIGKAGHGRIIFDGDNAQLRSANYAGGWNAINGKKSGDFSYSDYGMLIDLDDAFLIATQKNENVLRYIKIDGKTTGQLTTDNGKIIPTPSRDPHPAREGYNTDYPFVVYGGKNLYTEIGWNGDLKLKGSSASGGAGSISLDASGEIPFEIRSNSIIEEKENQRIYNRYVQINWDASIILSSYEDGFINKILLDASAPKLASLPDQYHLTEEKKAWVSASEDRPFQIGRYLRATWDGYLEAQGAFFKNSNANAFNVHYVLNDDSVSPTDNFFIGRGVAGTMGHVQGANENGYTDNVGLSSAPGHGIKLISETNLSISATNHSNTTKDENETKEQIASISQQDEENQTTNTNQYISTNNHISDIIYYFYDDKGEKPAYYKVQEDGKEEYEITNEDQFKKACDNNPSSDSKVLYYQLSNQGSSIDTPESETTVDENKSNSTVGGIYIEAGRIVSSKIMNEKNNTVTLQLLSDDGKMSNLVTNGFSILDLGNPKIDNNSYGLLMNLSLENTAAEAVSSFRRWKLEYNNLNNTIFNTGAFYIQNSEQKLLFNILEAKDTASKSQTTIQTDITILPVVNNKLETNGGIKITGCYSSEGYGLYNQNKTYLISNVGIGRAPDDTDKLYVQGNLTATDTIKLGINGSNTNPTITVSPTSVTFTCDAEQQTGIYARFA